MSKTYKTRPLDVRIADPNDHGVDAKEHHNHADGELCDLPESPREALKLPHTNCHYEYAYNGHGLHSCPLCTDKFGRQKKRRRERREAKETLRKEQLYTQNPDTV